MHSLFVATRQFLPPLAFLLAVLGIPPYGKQPAPPAADHHIHVLSETVAEYLQNEADLSIEAKDAGHVVQLMNEAGIETGVLLSVSYMFGRPGVDVANEYDKVQQENDFVARQAAQ